MFVKDVFLESDVDCCFHLIQLGEHYSHLCGPMKSPSFNGRRYFFIIFYDYIGMSWVYFLKEKSKKFEKFVEFKALVENMSGYLIKTLCIDSGGEFLSNYVESF